MLNLLTHRILSTSFNIFVQHSYQTSSSFKLRYVDSENQYLTAILHKLAICRLITGCHAFTITSKITEQWTALKQATAVASNGHWFIFKFKSLNGLARHQRKTHVKGAATWRIKSYNFNFCAILTSQLPRCSYNSAMGHYTMNQVQRVKC